MVSFFEEDFEISLNGFLFTDVDVTIVACSDFQNMC